MDALLSVSQARCLQITLRLFEERLREADGWLSHGGEPATLLYQQAVLLTPEQRAEVRELIAQALAEISALVETFALEQDEDDLRAHIRASMSSSWADLCDTRASKLERYGPIDPAVAPVLDTAVERLANLALTIAHRMGTGPT